ncbi:hypothetical protein A2U01_0099322, partial [Trifolium medium]|nr:hypothetical protein [Trifolium medium]
RVFESGGEEWVIMVEGDSEDSGWSRWHRGRVVWGLCAEKGGGWVGDIFLD